MGRPVNLFLLVAALLVTPLRLAAGDIGNCFTPGLWGGCTAPVLPKVQFKAIVLQFVDPAKTDLGESFSRLFWREILDSIYNLANAGVILAYDRQGEIDRALDNQDYKIFLESKYHAAAETIALQMRAQMSIWGAVILDGDGLLVQPFLTLEAQGDPWTTLTMNNGAIRGLTLGARIASSRLNLEPLTASRRHLFDRPFVTRCALSAGCPRGVPLRAEASNNSPIIDYTPVGSTVKAVEMQREWIKLLWNGDKPAYINVYHVEIFPLRVTFANQDGVILRAAPTPVSTRVAKVRLDGDYQVLDASRVAHGEAWYRIRQGNDIGWVEGRLVARRSYTFPAVYLISGLYRYGRGDYNGASKALQAYLAEAPDENNVIRAAAYQFLAASRVAGRSGNGTNAEAAIIDLNESVKLTPFDPAVYNLLAVVKLGSGHGLMEGLNDLEHSLKLDPTDADAQGLLMRVVDLSEHGYLNPLSHEPMASYIGRLRRQYLRK